MTDIQNVRDAAVLRGRSQTYTYGADTRSYGYGREGQGAQYGQPGYYNRPVQTPTQPSRMDSIVSPEPSHDTYANENARREGYGYQGEYQNRGIVGNAINRVLR